MIKHATKNTTLFKRLFFQTMFWKVKEMITMSMVDRIKHYKDVDKLSFTEIANVMGIDRKTVSTWYKCKKLPQYKRTKTNATIKQKIMPYLKHYVNEDTQLIQQGKRKSYRSAPVIKELLEEMGIKAGESTIRKYLAQLRPKEAFIPLVYEPGCDMQVDWGELVIPFEHEIRMKVYLFVATLPYSNTRFIYPYFRQDSVCFFDGLVKAFHFLGGVPKRITFDNLTTAVKKVLSGYERIEQDKMLHFKHVFGFQTQYCNVAKGNEKGSVENGVKYAKKRFLGGNRIFHNFDELRSYLMTCCEKALERRHYKHSSMTIGHLLTDERECFLPLPEEGYESFSLVHLKSSKMCLISVDGVHYSVPSRFSQRKVSVKLTSEEIIVYDIANPLEEIARHQRTHKVFQQSILDVKHYLPVLMKKPRALEYAACIKHAPMPQIFWDFLEMLKKHHSNPNVEMIKILNLMNSHTLKDIFFAMEWCYEHRSYSYDAVKICLSDITKQQFLLEPLTKSYPEVNTVPCNLDRYDLLLGGANQ